MHKETRTEFWYYFRATIPVTVIILVAAFFITSFTDFLSYKDDMKIYDNEHTTLSFWRAVNGENTLTHGTVESRFAQDLRNIVGSENQVEQFVGSSNRYGGITDAIKFDPFDSSGLNCNECGPLDIGTKTYLADIREGHFKQIEKDLTVAEPVFPFDLSTLLIGLILMIINFLLVSSVLVPLYWRGFKRDHYHDEVKFRDLEWYDHSGVWLNFALVAPLTILPYSALQKHKRKRFAKQVKNYFPEQTNLIGDIKALAASHPGDHNLAEMEKKADVVMAELEKQTLSGQTDDQSEKVKFYMNELIDTEAFLKERERVTKEL